VKKFCQYIYDECAVFAMRLNAEIRADWGLDEGDCRGSSYEKQASKSLLTSNLAGK
jgi:hypothetical protein